VDLQAKYDILKKEVERMAIEKIEIEETVQGLQAARKAADVETEWERARAAGADEAYSKVIRTLLVALDG